MKTFAERLRKLRRDRDISQNQLASIFGIKSAAVSKWEMSETYPTIETLIKLADYFQVTTDYLLRGMQTVPVSGGNIDGSTLTGSVIQTNFQSNVQGGIIVNGQQLSRNALTLAQLYEEFDARSQAELIMYAYRIKDKLAQQATS